MRPKLLGQFGQRLLAFHGSQGHLGLEGRRVVPARSSRHGLSCFAAILAAVRQKLHSSHLSKFPEPPLCTLSSTAGLLPLEFSNRAGSSRKLSRTGPLSPQACLIR